MKKVDHALALARRKFRVFPLIANDKRPLIEAFPVRATTDENKIRDWWTQWPDANIGVATGDDLVVIDYDTKDGKRGRTALEQHLALDLPKTFGVRTASGGVHLYFRPDAPTPNSTSLIAEHVDVRGLGGYVVGPGSTIDGVEYRAGHHIEIAPIPDWLSTAARTPKHTPLPRIADKTPLIELDRPEQIERAAHYIAHEAPVAVEGHGGDETTYRVAAKLHELGLSRETTLAHMVRWNMTHAQPPWTLADLEQKVDNAFKYARLPAGATTAKAEFPVVELSDSATSAPRNRALHFVLARDGIARALEYANKPLVDGLLDAGTMSVIYGKSNSGKTFVALDLAASVATATEWNTHAVAQQSAVLYVAAEGGAGIFKRLKAIQSKFPSIAKAPFAVVPCPIDLLRGTGPESDTRRLIDLVGDFERAAGAATGLIVIDTLSRALAGGDENSSTDMGNFIRHIDRLREHTKAHVLIIHHTGKDVAKGARGWSGIQAAIDTEIEVHENVVTVTKQRDLDPREPLRFDLAQVSVGTNARGKTVTSCTVAWREEGEFPVALSPAEEQMFAVAMRIAAEKSESGEVSDHVRLTTEEWDEAAKIELEGAGGPESRQFRRLPRGSSERRLRQLRQACGNAGLVKKVSKNEWVIVQRQSQLPRQLLSGVAATHSAPL